jgi:prevent-host-death family protein
MITVSKAVLKAKMLEYFRQVEQTGEPLIVTSHRKPVLKVEPIRERSGLLQALAALNGRLRGSTQAVLAPETDEWEDA